ncbi:MAG TPA: peptidase domain-containing ABC transporter [Polyangia bacterium]|jgi:ABC-type bacteriocin/lantibiotic exporter with double-glycine peptidase domain|nr:peptidase domain-containing ABC transporter [Polyangia bacterium]
MAPESDRDPETESPESADDETASAASEDEDENEKEDEDEDDEPGRWYHRFPALLRLGSLLSSDRVPFVQQLTGTECGAACLSMVLGYFGKNVRLEEVRDATGVDRDGTNAQAILDAARWYGLRGRGVTLEVDQLEYLPPATILHWEFRHFVVFEEVRKGLVHIVDPAVGRRKVPMAEFRRSFTGVALLLEPGEHFEESGKGGVRIWHYIRQVLGRTGHLPRIAVTSLLLQLFALSIPILTGALVDRVVPRSDQHLLLVVGVGLAALVVFYFLSSMIRAHLLLHLRTLLDVRMTLGFLDHMVDLPYAFFQRRSAGDLMMRLNSNATIREILTSGALSGLLDGTLVIFYLGLLFIASPLIGLLVLVLGILHVSVFLFSRRQQRELMAQNLHIQARSDSFLVELLAGIETLKATGTEQRAVEHWSDLFVDVLNVSLQRGRLSAIVDSLTATLRLASPLCILAVGALLVLKGEMSLGTMLALNALGGGFLGPLANLVATAGQLQLLGSYIERIDDVLRAEPEQDRNVVHQAHRLGGRIELDHVSFRYGPIAPMVVKDASLRIERGQFIALVGRSGSGKSTLASLIVGLYTPVSGRILYDGVDLHQIDLRSLRRQVGAVTQRPYLFGTSIRANIAYGDPELPLARVIAAARAACIHEDIAAMPLGYETPLIDAGASLSGGQRQRIALARALVQEPAILVLDEATSALDAVTEAQVQRSLDELKCTRVVIAHRLSTVVRADLILVMEDGRLVEQGRHEELIKNGGFYAKLVAAQLKADVHTAAG